MYNRIIKPEDDARWQKLREKQYDNLINFLKLVKEFGFRDDLRAIFSCVRSGSTPLMMTFLNNKNVEKAYYQFIKGALRLNGEPDYSILLNHPHSENNGQAGGSKKITLLKETLGPFTIEESSFNLLPPILQAELKDLIDKIRPLFLFRDPHQILSAMVNRKWDVAMGKMFAEQSGHKWDKMSEEKKEPFLIIGKEKILKHLEISYNNLSDTFEVMRGISDQVTCVTYGHLGGVDDKKDTIDQDTVIKTICHKWGIRHDKQMSNWEIPFDDVIRRNIPDDERKFITTPDFWTLYESEAFSNLSGATSFIPVEEKVSIDIDDINFIRKKGLDIKYFIARKRSKEYVKEARRKGLKDEKDACDDSR